MLGQDAGNIAVSIAEPIHQIGRAVVQASLASKQSKFEEKQARKEAAFLSAEAQKDLAIQLRAQQVKGPSFLPLILAGVGTLILLGGMIYFVSKD